MTHSSSPRIRGGCLVAFLIASAAFAQQAPLSKIRIAQEPVAGLLETNEPSITLTGTIDAEPGGLEALWMDEYGSEGPVQITPPASAGEPYTFVAGPVALRSGVNQITIRVPGENRGFSRTIAVLSRIQPTAPAEVRSGFWRGRRVQYEVIDGQAVLDGDMVLGPAAELERPLDLQVSGKEGGRREGHGQIRNSELWPTVSGVVTVPYTIVAGTNAAAAITAFNAAFPGQMQWVARTAETDYVTFNQASSGSGSCSSNVGRIGGQQFITGDVACQTGTLLHEIGHAMGLFHEHQRSDAATWVTYDSSNVDRSNAPGNFGGVDSDAQSVGLYDLASIMHYSATGFSKNRLPVLTTVTPGLVFGVRTGYSAGDIDQLLRMYSLAPSTVTVTTNPTGLPITVDGVNYTAPQTFSWTIGTAHTIATPSGFQTLSGDTAQYTFGSWNDSGAQSHSITVTNGTGSRVAPRDKPAVTVYQANYVRYNKVTVQLLGDGNVLCPATCGTVTFSPALTTIGSDTFAINNSVPTVTAAPAATYSFYRWFGTNSSPNGAASRSWPITSTDWTIQALFHTGTVHTVNSSLTSPGPPTGPNHPPMVATIDGTSYQLPVNFDGTDTTPWTNGTTHTLAVANPQTPVTTNVRYAWNSWSDGGAVSHTTSALGSSASTFTVNVTPSYRSFSYLSPSCGATSGVPLADSHYADGSVQSLSVTAASGWNFTDFSGDVTSTSNPTSHTIRDQVVVTANLNTTSTKLSITSLSPSTVVQSTGAQTIDIFGTGFTASTLGLVNLSFRTTTFVSSTNIRVQLDASDVTSVGGLVISAYNFTSSPSCGIFVSKDLQVVNQVRLTSSPAGNSFTVDGTTYTSTQSFNWVPGSSHTVSCVQTASGSGPQCTGWSDGLPRSHTISAPTAATTYTANYVTSNLVNANFSLISLSGSTAAPGCAAGGRNFTATALLQNNGTARTGVTSSLATLSQGATLTSSSWAPTTVANGATTTGTFNILLANCNTFQLFFDLLGT